MCLKFLQVRVNFAIAGRITWLKGTKIFLGYSLRRISNNSIYNLIKIRLCNLNISTVCVKDCGFHKQKIDMIILFACLVGLLDSLKKTACAYSCWREHRHGLCKCMHTCCTCTCTSEGPQSLAHCVSHSTFSHISPWANLQFHSLIIITRKRSSVVKENCVPLSVMLG